MNLDPVPPVRPRLTHVIADDPLRREAGINEEVRQMASEKDTPLYWRDVDRLDRDRKSVV